MFNRKNNLVEENNLLLKKYKYKDIINRRCRNLRMKKKNCLVKYL